MIEKKDIAVAARPLLMRPVRMVVVYKPTNECTMSDVSLKDCRAFFEAAVASMRSKLGMGAAQDGDFIAVQIDWEDKTVITTTL